MTMDKELSLTITSGGVCQTVSISGTSAQSAAINSDSAVIFSTVECFARAGANPTAVADGTDHYIPANVLLRINGLTRGDKLAFKTTGATGSVYVAPGA